MSTTQTLRCRECSRTYPLLATHICEFDFGPLEAQFDYAAIRASISRDAIAARPPTLWRYHDCCRWTGAGTKPGRWGSRPCSAPTTWANGWG